MSQFKVGDGVVVMAKGFEGNKGEIFKINSLDTLMPYDVMIEGQPFSFNAEELRHQTLDDVDPDEWTRAAMKYHVEVGQKVLKNILAGDKPAAMDVQVGGSHYKDCKIQPIEYIIANELGFCEGNVVKYVTRYASKGGKQDLEKARHYIDLLLESIE